MTTTFVLEYWQDDGWYVGKLKGFPGVFSQGETIEKLETNIADAYQMMLEADDQSPANAQTKPLVIDG